MRPVTVSVTGAGGTTNSAPVRMNWRGSPFNVSLGFSSSGSTTGFKVQMTYEDPNAYASAAAWNSGANWYDHPTMTGLTTAQDGRLDGTCQGVRLQANSSGTDIGTLIVTQGGPNT